MKFKQFILLGPPGIGVEEHAIALARRWRIPHVSVAQQQQQAIEQGTDLAAAAGSYGEAGEPVPDAVVMKLLKRRFEQPDVMLNGWVLDGFPRTLAQAQGFDALSAAFGRPAATVVYLKAMTGLLINRLFTEKGQAESVATIRRHLEQHQAEVAPLLDYYKSRSQLKTLNGSLPFAEVAHELAQLGYEDSGAVHLIKDEAELNALLAQKPLLVVDGMASWCGACKVVSPLIDQLANEYGDRATVMKMDFDVNPQILKRFALKGMPAVMVFKGGALVEKLIGIKTLEDYRAAISRGLSDYL